MELVLWLQKLDKARAHVAVGSGSIWMHYSGSCILHFRIRARSQIRTPFIGHLAWMDLVEQIGHPNAPLSVDPLKVLCLLSTFDKL